MQAGSSYICEGDAAAAVTRRPRQRCAARTAFLCSVGSDRCDSSGYCIVSSAVLVAASRRRASCRSNACASAVLSAAACDVPRSRSPQAWCICTNSTTRLVAPLPSHAPASVCRLCRCMHRCARIAVRLYRNTRASAELCMHPGCMHLARIWEARVWKRSMPGLDRQPAPTRFGTSFSQAPAFKA